MQVILLIPKKTSLKPKSSLGSSPSSNIHTVKASSINVRKEPSTTAEIVYVLHHKKSVRILKKVNSS